LKQERRERLLKKREKEDRMQRAKDEDFYPDAFDDDDGMVARKREKTPASAGKKRGRKAKV
jgi:hypothetical protein